MARKERFVDVWREEIYDVLSRAGKTFVQTLTAQLTVGAFVGGDYQAAKAALIAAFAAGFSVIWNALTVWSNSR